MKTAADFAQAAQDITNLSDRIKPALSETTPYHNARNEAVVYLRLAAKKMREIADALRKEMA
jgi:hypothetical protein